MDPESLIAAVRIAGGEIQALGWDRLQVRYPGGIPDDLSAYLKGEKWRVLAHLHRQRVEKGANMLFEMEQAGEVATPRYLALLAHYTNLLCAYEACCDQMQEVAA